MLKRESIKEIRQYSEVLKRQVVLEFESGRATVRELKEEYGIGWSRTIYRWCRKYGRNHRRTKVVRVIMKSEQERIVELEKLVAELTLQNRVKDAVIKEWEEEERSGRLKKKLSTERLKRLEALKAKLESIRSGSFVESSE